MEIAVEALKKSFDSQQVLDIEYLEFKKGLSCIMGPNGCGKSTLLNILSGQLGYDSGLIIYSGKTYSKDLASRITLVHQKPLLFNRSVYENIAYPLRVRRYPRVEIDKQVNSVLEKLEIKDLKDKNGTKLSGGESQKVALARGIIFNPELLMLDESTSNIDEKSMDLMESVIKDYANSNKTVIMVTHDPNQARKMTDNIVVL